MLLIDDRVRCLCHVDGNARLFPWQAADQGSAVTHHERARLSIFHYAFDRLARAAERLHADKSARGGDRVEFDVYNDHSSVEEFADVGVDAGFERRASLRWGGDFQEAVAGMSAAAALAKLMNGVVFDEAEDRTPFC